MGASIYIGIDAYRHRRADPVRGRNLVETFQFRSRLEIETANPCLQRLFHLRDAFPDPGEDDTGRVTAGAHNPRQLAAGDNVETRAEPGQQCQYRQIGVGLYSVTDQMRVVAQSLVEGTPMAFQGGAGVHIQWCTMLLCQLRQVCLLGVQATVPVGEVIHVG